MTRPTKREREAAELLSVVASNDVNFWDAARHDLGLSDDVIRARTDDEQELMDILSANLAIGAGLCKAFYEGRYFGAVRWEPGCGRRAP